MERPALAGSSAATSDDLVFRGVFDAPRALVWQVWTEPRHLTQWWGPHAFINSRVELDLRPGGALSIDMKGDDGVSHVTGEIREVVEPERLVFTTMLVEEGQVFAEILNTVMFADHADDASSERRTEVTLVVRVLRAAPEAAAALGGMHEAWRQSLERLESEVSTTASREEMIVSRTFDAPRDLVFDAWTDPAHVGEWWGPAGFTTTTQRFDLRPGGVWSHVMHGPDGVDYPNLTEFIEVDRPSRLVYTNSGGAPTIDPATFTATVTFDEQEGRTRVTMRARFQSAAQKAWVLREYGAYEGAHQMFDRLTAHLIARASDRRVE